MILFLCSIEWQQWPNCKVWQPLEDETGYKEAKMKAVDSDFGLSVYWTAETTTIDMGTTWSWTGKRNILSHTNLFRYFKIFNKCIDFGCMFIVVHKSWGPAPEYWLLTNKKKAEVPNCFLMVVQGGLGPVDYVSQWLSHQRGDGYCNEALDFSLVRTEQDSSLGLRFFCQNLGHLGHRTSRLILLLEMMAWSSLHLVTNCIPLVNRDRATSGSAECLRDCQF